VKARLVPRRKLVGPYDRIASGLKQSPDLFGSKRSYLLLHSPGSFDRLADVARNLELEVGWLFWTFSELKARLETKTRYVRVGRLLGWWGAPGYSSFLPLPPSSLSSRNSVSLSSPTMFSVSSTSLTFFSSSTCSVTNHCRKAWLA
jgi:hypothetical protein